ncbi:hypothetical protein GCM10012275_14560 [Longimycelium tulufanense]|uniref:Uncharacterized protein n=1 Tax=Longimycelium tulufanense TaxID=907463 RepID=A0A8J3CAJ6_9PSEU|nr:hypothetical protein GCM10012275_14560 [Longimycelium tulufanense]
MPAPAHTSNASAPPMSSAARANSRFLNALELQAGPAARSAAGTPAGPSRVGHASILAARISTNPALGQTKAR